MDLRNIAVVFERHPIEPGGHDIDWLERRCPRCRQRVESARGPEFGMETEGSLKGMFKRGPVGTCEEWGPHLHVVLDPDGRVAPCTYRDRAIAMSGEEAWKGSRVVEYAPKMLLDEVVERVVRLKRANGRARSDEEGNAWRALVDLLVVLGYGKSL